jgi:cobalamin synthase
MLPVPPSGSTPAARDWVSRRTGRPPTSRRRRGALLRTIGAGALLALYTMLLATYGVLRAHSADPAFVLILILAVAGMLSMLGVAAANLWARSRPAATTGARVLTRVCLALIVAAAIALAGIGMLLSATANGLAFLQAIVWIIGILIAALPTAVTLRALGPAKPGPAEGTTARHP